MKSNYTIRELGSNRYQVTQVTPAGRQHYQGDCPSIELALEFINPREHGKVYLRSAANDFRMVQIA